MNRNRIYFIMLFLCIIVTEGCGRTPEIEKNKAEVLEISEEPENSDTKTAEKTIYVQVSGAVISPGVYELPEGSRIFEAIELAGGMTEDADAEQLNQAENLSDGQMIYVTRQGEIETTGFTEGQYADGKVNLNTATEEQLMTLPGIGQAKAKSIISWREENGGFTRIEDLMEIEGIKEGVFSKIKDSIKVN